MNNKVALISGGANGMGKAIAEYLYGTGVQIAVLDIDVQADANPDYISVRGDVSNEDDWKEAIHIIRKKWDRLDILINAAGILGRPEPIDSYSTENFERIMNINLKGTFLGIKHASALIKKGGGTIVNFASLSSYGAQPGNLGYVSSKHAIIGMTKTAALDLVGYGIRVNAVAPGIIDTPMFRNAVNEKKQKFPDIDFERQMTQIIPMKRLGNSMEVAKVIAFLISDEAGYITGATIPVDGGVLTK